MTQTTDNKCLLVQRGHMYDVYLNGKFVGKGQRQYIATAYHVYKEQGFDVEITSEA